MDARRVIARIQAAAKGLTAKIRRTPPAAMTGIPPSSRKLPAIPADPALHAIQSAHEWSDVAESYVQRRMRELEIPERQIGAIEYAEGGIRLVFSPTDRRGGTNDAFGRLYVDSGILNPDLTTEKYGPNVTSAWAKARLRDRIDAVIAHEHAEVETGSHDAAEALAPDTPLPVSDGARNILRTILQRDKPSGREP